MLVTFMAEELEQCVEVARVMTMLPSLAETCQVVFITLSFVF